jgi:hypothetical protein
MVIAVRHALHSTPLAVFRKARNPVMMLGEFTHRAFVNG